MRLRDRVRRPSHGTVVGYVALVVALSGSAYAATGGTFTLGQDNRANRVTELKNTGDGSALRLVTDRPGTAPLKVSNDSKIKKLNADKVDGKSAKALKPIVRTDIVTAGEQIFADGYENVAGLGVGLTVPGNSSRRTLITYTAECSITGMPGDFAGVRITVDGTPLQPGAAEDFAFCSAQSADANKDQGWVSAALQSFVTLAPGSHTIRVQGSPRMSDELRLDDHTLSVVAYP